MNVQSNPGCQRPRDDVFIGAGIEEGVDPNGGAGFRMRNDDADNWTSDVVIRRDPKA